MNFTIIVAGCITLRLDYLCALLLGKEVQYQNEKVLLHSSYYIIIAKLHVSILHLHTLPRHFAIHEKR